MVRLGIVILSKTSGSALLDDADELPVPGGRAGGRDRRGMAPIMKASSLLPAPLPLGLLSIVRVLSVTLFLLQRTKTVNIEQKVTVKSRMMANEN